MKNIIPTLLISISVISCSTSIDVSPNQLQARNAAMLQKFEVNGWRFYNKVPEMPLPLLTKDGSTLAYRRDAIEYTPSQIEVYIKKQPIAFYVYAELYKPLDYSKEKFNTALYNELLRERADVNYIPQYVFSVWSSTSSREKAVLVEKVKY